MCPSASSNLYRRSPMTSLTLSSLSPNEAGGDRLFNWYLEKMAKNLLDFDDNNIEILQEKGISSLHYFKAQTNVKAYHLLNLPHTFQSQQIEYFIKYYIGYQPSYNTIIDVTFDKWDDIHPLDVKR